MIRIACLMVMVLVSCLHARETVANNWLIPIKGTVDYIHGAPEPIGVCTSPVPGVELAVTGQYHVNVNGINLGGDGAAVTCVFDQPLFGIYAKYDGSFQWQSEDGEILTGKYIGFDTNPTVLIEPSLPFVLFETIIFITFTDSDGNFAGLATARGYDIPFGNPATSPPDPAGVFASFRGFLINTAH
ncbi:hypothetical protein Enr13x_46110 [Stieleria neptunia]|uniref:Uncharacterized protein n=1 Tax=Stieleria neptunia TaxID=2527979 RepID=A0A518HV51_9BACT|nr:hypothetical protein [Stieleria neptunia]QDV44741.1 hypothetical protein Enr13x_46110 [Stieleria neptunia]